MSVDNADKCLHSVDMTLREQIILMSERYGALAGIGRKRVSTIVFNRSSKLDDLYDGGDLSTGIFERAMQWFSDHWPAGAEWPAGIHRPEPRLEAAE
jgi:hypothetical protein